MCNELNKKSRCHAEHSAELDTFKPNNPSNNCELVASQQFGDMQNFSDARI